MRPIRLFVFLVCLSMPGTVLAQASNWAGIDEAQVRLISATSALGERTDHVLGLEFKMQKGWKVYWRSPGDAGYPPEMNWQGSDNLQSANLLWPRPERFEVLGLQTLGYKDAVIYPLEITVQDPSQDLKLQTSVRFLTCSEICVPVESQLALTLPAGSGAPSDYAHRISQARSLVPPMAQTQGVKLLNLVYLSKDTSPDGMARLGFELESELPFAAPDAIADGPYELVYKTPDVHLSDGGKRAFFSVPIEGVKYLKDPIFEQTFHLTVLDGPRAFEAVSKAALVERSAQDWPFQTEPPLSVGGDGPALSLPVILIFALIGGLILNLMPCVLPVLSLKVIGLVKHGGGQRRAVRSGFIATAFGIVFAFWLLAAMLIALKAGGTAIGWGIQFQQPLFLIGLAFIVTLFAANLLGYFEIHLPESVSTLGGTAFQGHHLGGHFASGMFATLLATPCSAPFLGTAVGFALSRGSFEIALIFTVLGLGLALPYLMVATFPALATALPKPGGWMITLKKIMALALIATALWLVSVLSAQIGLNGAFATAALLAGLLLVLGFSARIKRLVAIPVILILVSASLIPSSFSPEPHAEAGREDIWHPFDEAEIKRLVAEGNVVLVDVTADWCITCQVNKKLVLNEGAVFQALSGPVHAMKADWTNPDDRIAAYLARYKRFAIPFNAVYGPGAPEGIILSEILTERDVMAAIEKARGG